MRDSYSIDVLNVSKIDHPLIVLIITNIETVIERRSVQLTTIYCWQLFN